MSVDMYQAKQQFSAMVDDIGYCRHEIANLRNEMSEQRRAYDNLHASFDGLCRAYGEQVAYFNQLIPGFTDGFRARLALDAATKPDNPTGV